MKPNETLNAQKGKSRGQNLTIVFSIVLAAILLYFALRNIDWTAFLSAIKNVRVAYLLFLILWSHASFFMRSLRLRVLLRIEKPIPISHVFWANMTGYLGNTVLPARAGEFMRAAYVARQENIPTAYVFAAGMTERLVDLAALVVIGAASVFFANAFPGSVQDALKTFALVAILGVAFIFLLPIFHDPINKILFALPLLPQNIKTKLGEMANHFVEGIKVISHLERGLPFLLFTGLIWLMDGVGTTLMAFALHETLTLAQAFLFIAALGLSSAIPSTPGYVGVYQFVAVTVLVPFGFTRESALAFILISQALNLIIVALWGGIGLWLGSQGIIKSKPKEN